MVNYNKFSVEQFKERLEKIFPEWKYEIISFNGYKQPLTIKCLNCSQIININKAGDLLKRVNPCSCKKIFKNTKEKIEYLSKVYNFEIIEEGNSQKDYIIKCNNCGTIMKRNSILIKATPWHCEGCNCYNEHKVIYKKEEVQEELNKKFGVQYELLEYSGITKKALIKHINCGKIFTVGSLQDLFNGRNRGCPVCYQFKSVGEQTIMQYLDEHNIIYIPQKTFSPLNKSKYRFDFYIPSLNLAIEYQGEQHFRDTNFFKDDLATVQHRDAIKRKYCKENNIILKEITYKELKNINHILDLMFNDYPKGVASSEAKQM